MKTLLIAASAAAALLASSPALSTPASDAAWVDALERAVDANLQYPDAVAPARPTEAEVTFTVSADGRLGEAVVILGTRDVTLDDAVVEAVRRTGRVASPPPALVGRPIVYRATFAPARQQASR